MHTSTQLLCRPPSPHHPTAVSVARLTLRPTHSQAPVQPCPLSPVVPFAHTVVEPLAVVVEAAHTLVAGTAVLRASTPAEGEDEQCIGPLLRCSGWLEPTSPRPEADYPPAPPRDFQAPCRGACAPSAGTE